MPKKKVKKSPSRPRQVVDNFARERREVADLIEKRQNFTEKQTAAISEAKGFKKIGMFFGGAIRRASLNKQINQRAKLIKGEQIIKQLKQTKEIVQLKKQIDSERPKPITLEDINKPIQPIKADDIFKPLQGGD